MRFISKRALVALVAVFALSAAAAASASAALPEFNFGKTTPSYTAKTGELRVLENKTVDMTCGGGTSEGSVTGAKTLSSKFTFTGCRAPSSVECKSVGAASGEVKTGVLMDELVYTAKAKKEAGLIFNQTEAHKLTKPTFASIVCGATEQQLSVVGGAIAPVTEPNIVAKQYKFTLSVESSDHQTPDTYENEKGEKLYEFPETSILGGTPTEGAFTMSIETNFSQILEISA